MRTIRESDSDAIRVLTNRALAERIPLGGWRMTRPARDECVRWESPEGRWVSITLVDAGASRVQAFDGRCEVLLTFDEALRLAEQVRCG